IMPYMEQQAFIDGIDLFRYWQNEPNRAYLYGHEVPFLRCPSQSDMEITYTDPPGGSGTEELSKLRTHYMAVHGAKAKCPVVPFDPYPTRTYTLSPKCDPPVGGMATNGVINLSFPTTTTYESSRVSVKSVVDGTSHTVMIGEISWLCGPQRIWAVGTATQ